MFDDYTILLFAAFTALFTILGAIITALVIRRSLHLNHLHSERHRLIYESKKLNIQEGERMINEISKEIHDNIGSAATLAKISLRRVTLLNINAQLVNYLDDIGKQIDNIHLDVNHISHSANHNYIKDRDLSALLQEDLEFMQVHKEITTDFLVNGNVRTFTPEVNLLVYRIAQQAFTNIIKHSGATEVTVKLDYGQRRFEMSIEDNGIGISSTKLRQSNGIGFGNMRDRATVLNGNLTLKTNPNKGCTITLTIPEVSFI